MTRALREHWPEYLMEAFGLGAFMVAAAGFGTLLEFPGSPFRRALPDPLLRRGLMGLAMGLTAVAIIYSPWGKRSGAHLNPAVTLTFLRLGRVRPADAAFYVAAQCAGGVAGVALAGAVLGRALADPPVSWVTTVPGEAGAAAAFLAELAISFVLMAVILAASGSPRLAASTGLLAGALVALYITLEAPYSGMSMNPARTLASALPAGRWTALWIYLLAPPAGMLAAGELHLRAHAAPSRGCAKLVHPPAVRCIFCGQEAAAGRPSPAAPAPEAGAFVKE